MIGQLQGLRERGLRLPTQPYVFVEVMSLPLYIPISLFESLTWSQVYTKFSLENFGFDSISQSFSINVKL